MTAVLRCDNCDDTSRRGDDVSQWWEVTRFHEKEVNYGQPVQFLTSTFTVVEEEEHEQPEPEPDDVERLHFCCTGCLSAWATAASMLEK